MVGEYNFTEILVQCQFYEIFLAMCNFLAVSKYMTKLGEIADKNDVFNSYLFFLKNNNNFDLFVLVLLIFQ